MTIELTKDLIKGFHCPQCGSLFCALDKRRKYCSLSKIVCGLHVWDNLQLLSETDNKRKGNSFNGGVE